MKRLILVIAVALMSLSLNAQTVGLVLSGGGAKGLYHVGMLKALEENGIPIDYVSGASMGAIVGAMYVSGYSPDEMLEFFATDSVRTWLSGKIPEEYHYYFTKFAPTPQIISLKINPDTVKLMNILELPTNVISPHRIDLAFLNMLGPPSAAANNNFDSLMVPFRCVASDTYNKKSVVFKSGSLGFAVRASMTIPLVFRPVRLDSMLLYDGGVYNNFPWQPLEEDMKPDIYIGGICSGNYKNPGQNDILGQVSVMITQNTEYTLPDSTGIIIQRRLPEINTLDYDKAAYIMACGYEDAMRQMPDILSRIERRVSPEEIAEKRRAFKAKIPPLRYNEIRIEGLTPEQTEYLNKQLDVRDGVVTTSSERFEEKYMRILATDVFTGEFPVQTYDSTNGYYQVKLDMSTQPSMKLALGGNISSSSLNQLYLGLSYKTAGLSVATYDLNAYLGTFYNALDIGGRHDIFTRFPFYIEYYLGGETFKYNTNNSKPYYTNQAWRSLEHKDYFAGVSWAVPFYNNFAARVKLSGGKMKDKYFETYHTSVDTPCESEFSYFGLVAEVQHQAFNYNLYPSKGTNQMLQFGFKIGLENFTPGNLPSKVMSNIRNRNRNWVMARYMREQYVEINRWFTLGYMFDATISNHPKFANDIASAITEPVFAPTPLSKTLFMHEYRSPSYIGAGVMPIINFAANGNFYLKTFLYGFVPQDYFYDAGWQNLTMNSLVDKYQLIFGGSLVYQSVIGPASLTVTKFTTGPANWHVSLNIGYNLFSNRKR